MALTFRRLHRWTSRRLLYLAVAAAVALPAGLAQGQDASAVSALIRDLKATDFDKAPAAAEQLRKYPQSRAQIVPALIEAIRTRDWNRCGADVRDTIARTLGELKAKEAVVPLLEVVKSGKPIEHECVE
jgi:HEAT repeat protein